MGKSIRAADHSSEEPNTTPIDYEILPPLRRSPAGIASFVIALAAIAALVAVFYAINGRSASDMGTYKLLALALILPVFGTLLGVISLFQPRRYRELPIAGLTINALLCLFLLLVIVPSLLHELFWAR